MNYRHIYHAGNFADIFKHIILCLCLEKLQEKDSPFFILDTHAGTGKYDLMDEKSQKTGEAENGIKKIIATKKFDFLPQKYLAILAKTNCCEINELNEKLRIYAGSPTIIKYFLRPQDKAFFAEKHHETFTLLKRNFAGNKKVFLSMEDGFNLIKSKLPPLEKRGLILIDPSFDKDQSKISADYQKIIETLLHAKKRFSHGIYLIWHPIIFGEEKLLTKFYQEIYSLNFPKIFHSVFTIDNNSIDNKMTSCGIFVINPPWHLEENLNSILPKVLQNLK